MPGGICLRCWNSIFTWYYWYVSDQDLGVTSPIGTITRYRLGDGVEKDPDTGRIFTEDTWVWADYPGTGSHSIYVR